jgi:hypothetical protein
MRGISLAIKYVHLNSRLGAQSGILNGGAPPSRDDLLNEAFEIRIEDGEAVIAR